MIKRIGKRTLALENRPYLLGHAAAVGKKEGEGPLGERFDYVAKNDRMGQRSWELAESELQKTAIRLALRKPICPLPSWGASWAAICSTSASAHF